MSDTLPRIAFCITCKGRAQHIKQTLPQNLIDATDYPNAVFILLNYNSPDDLMDYVRNTHAADVAGERLIVYSYEPEGGCLFHMTHAKNMAHRLGVIEGADILVNLDADNYLGRGFAWRIADTFKTHGPDCYMAIGRIVRGVTPRGVCGRIVVPVDAFINAGGYDESFETWSPDDKDFNMRVARLGYKFIEMPSVELECVRHNDKMRFREYPHVRNSAHSEALVLENRNNTVVNYGRFGCGVVRKNFGHELVFLGVMPTRVFGIGMHKTGTTSLHHALNLLGLSSAHWVSAHWAKRIWREMNNDGRSPTLERHYALCDMPISNLFRKLDKAYPGSKFILTLRNEDEWVSSVRRHYDPRFNQYQQFWATDPFTNIIHKVTYGRTDFDEATCRQRYRRHNAAVLEYFKHRPDDLLIMTRHKWEPLCAFLRKPVPAAPYPAANNGKTPVGQQAEYVLDFNI